MWIVIIIFPNTIMTEKRATLGIFRFSSRGGWMFKIDRVSLSGIYREVYETRSIWSFQTWIQGMWGK